MRSAPAPWSPAGWRYLRSEWMVLLSVLACWLVMHTKKVQKKNAILWKVLSTTRLQQDQEFSISGLPGRDFAKSRYPGIFRDGISLKFLSRDFTEKVWIWANLTNYVSPDGEFRCCHLVLGIFRPQIHVFWGPMGKKMRSSENEDYIRYVVLIFGNSWVWWEHCVLREEDSMHFSFSEIRYNHVVLIFRYSWKPRKMVLFAAWTVFLGGIFLLSNPEFILAGVICQKPHSIWSIWAPRAPFVIFTLYIWSHHRARFPYPDNKEI